MSPILESIGSVKGFGWGALLSSTSYESIATTTVGATAVSSISFTSIPATFTHLQLRSIVRGSKVAAYSDFQNASFNSDTTYTNYVTHYTHGDGANTGSTQHTQAAGTYACLSEQANNSIAANVFAFSIADILDYANTSKYKTIRRLGGWDGNGSGESYFTSSLWMSTSAINSITITPPSGTILQYSSFALYGIKG